MNILISSPLSQIVDGPVSSKKTVDGEIFDPSSLLICW
uniref:Uncharacterized protein n=1 Tax=Arundo donax TaxID=35708 RepID=A0A0A8YMN9_ARUDO